MHKALGVGPALGSRDGVVVWKRAPLIDSSLNVGLGRNRRSDLGTGGI